MEIKEAIKLLKTCVFEKNQEKESECFKLAIEALTEKLEREENEPLTLEQLKNIEDEPVYEIDYGWID